MTTQEFSNEFDILFNNISSNAAPGLNEYEKSVLLTKAQLEILRNYFNPMGNKYREGFDGSQKRQIDFSGLIKVSKPLKLDDTAIGSIVKFDDRSVLYYMPDDILYILNETARVTYDKGCIKNPNGYEHKITIVPMAFDEYNVMNARPYKQPYKQQGWRLLNRPGVQTVNGAADYISEIIVKEGAEMSNYTVRYVRMPQPIILMDFSKEQDFDEKFVDLTVMGRNKRTECELDPSIHNEILQRAVEIAKNAYIGDINTMLQLGTRSE